MTLPARRGTASRVSRGVDGNPSSCALCAPALARVLCATSPEASAAFEPPCALFSRSLLAGMWTVIAAFVAASAKARSRALRSASAYSRAVLLRSKPPLRSERRARNGAFHRTDGGTSDVRSNRQWCWKSRRCWHAASEDYVGHHGVPCCDPLVSDAVWTVLRAVLFQRSKCHEVAMQPSTNGNLDGLWWQG